MNSGVAIASWITLALSSVATAGERLDKLTYHNDAQRTGWNAQETLLTPRTVAGASFGLMWRSPPFDAFEDKPPRLFASPLYVDGVVIGTAEYAGRRFSVVYAVTTTGYAYAVNAFAAGKTPPGAILWRSRLTEQPWLKGAFGNLSTPVIDLRRQRLYVTSCDEAAQWRVHALDIRNGKEASGWPVPLDHAALNASGINKNGATRFPEMILTQRGALNLSADGSRVYVTFGGDFASGWIVAVDTTEAKVATAFSTAPVTEEPQGGMWSSGGPSVDPQGRLHVTTGASSAPALLNRPDFAGVFPHSAHQWGQSIIQLRDDPQRGFELTGTYTPFNYCQTASTDIDLGSSSTIVIDLDPATTGTPHLLALGGAKQGNIYLLDRTRLPGNLTQRPPCSTDSASDGSLLSPEPQLQFGQRGPINLFAPYTDRYAIVNQARSRSTAAYFRDARGKSHLFVTGSAKTGVDFTLSTPPGLARVEIMTAPAEPAYLRVDQLEQTQTFHNPGSPIVTSRGGKDAIVWVLDENAPRLAELYGPGAPRPVLYAFDALSFKLLWKSQPGDLHTSGKYNEPTVVRGTVFVGTDRIEAFGLRPAGAKALQPATFDSPPIAAAGAGGATMPGGIDPAALFAQRCAGCHSFGLPGIPTREKLATLTREKILDVLLNGVMQTQALGLSKAEMDALAGYLVGKDAEPGERLMRSNSPRR